MEWRKHLKTRGTLVTDAKSLYDYMHKTGALMAERGTALDLLAAKELMEQGVTKLNWVPSVHQLADVMTKQMESTIFETFMKVARWTLVLTEVEQTQEKERAEKRRGYRQRRKERKTEAKASSEEKPKQGAIST